MIMTSLTFNTQARLLMQLLPLIARESQFALKGGTAINYFYRDMPRLSVDIDLTYLPLKNRVDTLQDISESLYRLSVLIKNKIIGTNITEKKSTTSGQMTALIVQKDKAPVKIEPNLVIRGSVFGTKIQRLCSSAGKHFQASMQINTLSIADIYGSKICAALDRQHPRDFFDVKLLLDNEGLTDDIRKAFLVYLISHNRPMHELLNPNFMNIQKIFVNEFQGMTFIPITLTELLETRKTLLKQIHTDLTSDERYFLISVKEIHPVWEKLGINGIDKLPGVLWKLHNLKRMSKKKHIEALEKLKQCLDN